MKYIVNKLGVLVKPRPPSPYGYYIGLREVLGVKNVLIDIGYIKLI